jgi:excisionase family DNA binding protein
MNVDISEWMTIKEAAKYLHVSIAFLRKCVRLRRVPFARAGTKSLRFRRSDLDKWLESNGTGGEIMYRKN